MKCLPRQRARMHVFHGYLPAQDDKYIHFFILFHHMIVLLNIMGVNILTVVIALRVLTG